MHIFKFEIEVGHPNMCPSDLIIFSMLNIIFTTYCLKIGETTKIYNTLFMKMEYLLMDFNYKNFIKVLENKVK